jgi:hypothetical protein
VKTLSDKLEVGEITTNKYGNEGISKRYSGYNLMKKKFNSPENRI